VAAIGFPAPVTWQAERFLKEHGFDVRIKRLRWRIPFGLEVSGAEYYCTGNEIGTPLLYAEHLEMELHPIAALEGGMLIEEVFFTNGTIQVATYAGPIRDRAPENLLLEHIGGVISVEEEGIRIATLGKLKELSFDARGTFALPSERDYSKSLLDLWMGNYFPNATGSIPVWVSQITREFNACRFDGGGKILATFALHPLDLAANTVRAFATGSTFRCRGVKPENWTLSGGLYGSLLDVTNAVFSTDSGIFSLLTQVDFTNETIEASAKSSLPPDDILSLFPERWIQPFYSNGFHFGKQATATVSIGPAKFDTLLDDIKGDIRLNSLSYKKIPLNQTRILFEMDGDTLWLNQCDANVGSGNSAGPLQVSGMLYFENHTFVNHLTTQFNPSILTSLCGKTVSSYINALDINQQPPTIKGTLTGNWDHLSTLKFVGHCQANNFSFEGVPVQQFSTDLLVTNDFLGFTNMLIVRPEGKLNGTLSLPFARYEALFNIISTLNPTECIGMVHPVMTEILAPLAFSGSANVEVEGSIDYLTRTQMNFQVQVLTTNLTIYKFPFDQASFTIQATDDEYRVTSMKANIYDGEVLGSGAFFPVDDALYRYNLTSHVETIDFNPVVKLLSRHPEKVPTDIRMGHLTGDVQLSGLTGSNWLQSIVSKGNVAIDNGCLLQIPLFGPLSRLLSRLVPNLGCLAQTEFQSNVKIQEGILRIDKAYLYGNVISIVMNGDYIIKTDTLNIDVQIKLLRKGLIAKLINLITYPFTKIFLEFHLGGTLSDPVWRPVNVPKELYLDFK